MKKWKWNLLLALLAMLGHAMPSLQQNIAHQIVASQYNNWQVAGYSPDTYSFSPTVCKVQGGASFFYAFTVGVPVLIRDGNPSLSEVVTPALVIIDNTTCAISITPLNHHNLPFSITSATGGLQEALTANLQNEGNNTVILDNAWHNAVGSSANSVIAAAHGGFSLGLVDVTTLPSTWYQWNGTQYVAISIGGVNSVFGRTGTVVAVNGDYSCAQVTGCGAGYGFVFTVGSTQGASDTTLTADAPLTGVASHGTFFVDGEYESYTGISGSQFTGITRGVALTTPSTHSPGPDVMSVDIAFSPFTQPPLGGVFGYGNGSSASMLLATNCGTPQPLNFSGHLSVFTANCGGNSLHILSNGQILQENSNVVNILGPTYIAPSLGTVFSGNFPIPVTNTTLLAQTNAPQQFALPVGFTSPLYGPVRALPVPNIPAPSLSGATGTGCSITYVVAGVDADGNAVPGTGATINALQFIPGIQGIINIQTPQVAGVVTYNAYRTVVTGTCGTATVGKFTTALSTQFPFFQDTGATGDGTSPPATNTSVAKSCVGSASNPELYCTLAGTTSTPPVACSSSTAGWLYINTTATTSPNHAQTCQSSSWTGVY